MVRKVRTRKRVTIEDKIKAAETAMINAKDRYDKAAEELNRLLEKKREMDSKELLKAFEKSDRTLSEVLKFLGTTGTDDDE